MTRPIDKHLDCHELEGLIEFGSAAAQPDCGSPIELEEARRHAAICQDCAGQVSMQKRAQNQMQSLREGPIVTPGPGCSSDADWIGVAGGLLPPDETRRLLLHAAKCSHCGLLLRNAQAALSDEVSELEDAIMSSLESARPGWQSNMAVMLQNANAVADTRTARHTWPSWLQAPRYRLAFAAACCALVLAVWIGFRISRPPTVDQLLASAFTEHRTLDIRLRGSKFSPVLQERGSGQSALDKSPSLLKAEVQIGENLPRHASDPDWLDAKARADLLEGNYDPAILTLQHALESAPDSPNLLTDLGSAYFARAGFRDNAVDYGYAIESFSKALAKSSDDPVALYNRAAACRKLYLFDQAIDDWEHMRHVDPDSDWAGEAAKQSEMTRKDFHARDTTLFGPLLDPAKLSGNDAANLRQTMSARFEDYFRAAQREWLPKGFPVGASAESGAFRRALEVLAGIARDEHQDTWLGDLLRNTSSPDFSLAAAAFASAVQHNTNGEDASGLDQARKAAQLFHAAGNPAGELGATLEQIYSNQILREGDACMELLRGVHEKLEHSSYQWLRAQADLEESACAEQVDDPQTYRSAIKPAMDRAEKYGYGGLYLRGLGFRSFAETSAGDGPRAFHDAADGLRRFWSGQGDLMKGYNFYASLNDVATLLQLTNLKVFVNRQATSLIDRHPDIVLRAMAHRWYGNAAYVAGMPKLATDEYSRASALFASGQDQTAIARDRLDADIILAETQIRQGDLAQAAATLRKAGGSLGEKPSFNPEILYYNALADLAIQEKDSAQAEPSLRSAIFLSEWGRAAFPSENDRRSWAEQSRSAYRNAVEWKLRSGDPLAALELWEWYRGADLRSVEDTQRPRMTGLESSNPPDARNAPPLPAPDAVARRMPQLQDQTNFAYAVFPDGIALWLYDDRGVDAKWITVSAPTVRQLAAQLHWLCADRTSDVATLKQVARSLYDALIAPVEDRLQPGRPLVIEPDDFLKDLPWDALIDRNGNYLVQRASVTVSPGLYRAMSLRQGEKLTGRSPALVVSVPAVTTEGLETLVDADAEADSVAHNFSSAVLRGKEATLETIRARISGAEVFHFAGHALAVPGRGGLALEETVTGQDGEEHARLISAGSLSADETQRLQLAVLSACRTAANRESAESGTEDLSEWLLHANVPHVVASRWNVDSSQTAALMTRFYAQLLSGSGTAVSLRGAELELASQPGTAHPYYWSAFQLEGLK